MIATRRFVAGAVLRGGSLSVTCVAANAARRRAYTEAVIDWARTHQQSAQVFIAGDFNFELRAENETNLYTDNLKHDSEAYSYLLRYFRDMGRDAGATAINNRRIDYSTAPQSPCGSDASKYCAQRPSGAWITGRS
ncbi:MAG: hypothetical protein DMF64_12085 [Acidobacteria bacterium]|nr:MAG: hypothetical protein DMF64_12085 [Acidobacteriota bacterium]